MQIEEMVKIENGMQIIDIEEYFDKELGKYDLLSEIFHTESAVVSKDMPIGLLTSGTSRYFGGGEQCYNCGMAGHTIWKCPSMRNSVCLYCAGDHSGSRCSFILCTACNNLGHHEKGCRERRLPRTICKSCTDQHHLAVECPRPWRIYKLKNHNRSKKLAMSCAYCYKNDHFIDDCSMKDRKFSIFIKTYYRYLVRRKKKGCSVSSSQI